MPFFATAIPEGSSISARTAGPPSPEKPRFPSPASTWNLPDGRRRRISSLSRSTTSRTPFGATANAVGVLGVTKEPDLAEAVFDGDDAPVERARALGRLTIA